MDGLEKGELSGRPPRSVRRKNPGMTERTAGIGGIWDSVKRTGTPVLFTFESYGLQNLRGQFALVFSPFTVAGHSRQ